MQENLSYKTFIKVKSIVCILEKKQMDEARVAAWRCSTLRQKRDKESAKYVMKNVFQVLSIPIHTQTLFP